MEVTCNTCGRSFTAKRSDAKYCSGRCRVRALRDRNSPDEPKRPRPPLPPLFRNAVSDLWKSTERLRRLTEDDRFIRNRASMEDQKHRIKSQIIELQRICDELEGK